MKKQHRSSRHIGSVIVLVALLIVLASVLYTNHLARQIKADEQQRVELWAEATRRLINANDNEDLSFYLSIIEANTNIPVYIVDQEGTILDSRNVRHPVSDPRTLSGPIELRIDDENVQYIYYDESVVLTRLEVFPYIECGLILIFILVAVITLITVQRSEQDRVWVGLSKETAHQLGTPISSLNAWQELLHNRYPDDTLIPEMRQDIDRLGVIAERFSKVGSTPELKRTDVNEVIEQTAAYMRTRISDKVTIDIVHCALSTVNLNEPLFGWVLENLLKNALDAMSGVGTITIVTTAENEYIHIDISDTGRGIDHNLYRTIFEPGYTSKQRGWGLGLSLSKRIIEDYHRGKLFVKNSEVGGGTTFRISLKQAEDC